MLEVNAFWKDIMQKLGVTAHLILERYLTSAAFFTKNKACQIYPQISVFQDSWTLIICRKKCMLIGKG